MTNDVVEEVLKAMRARRRTNQSMRFHDAALDVELVSLKTSQRLGRPCRGDDDKQFHETMEKIVHEAYVRWRTDIILGHRTDFDYGRED